MKLDLIDVFGVVPLLGNPLGVVHDAEAWTTEQMQALTRWMGFSEMTFLLPPTDPLADYQVRIFTPGHELPFAGHPTLGSCHAWLARGGVAKAPDKIVQQCGIGLVDIRRIEGELAFSAPALSRYEPLTEDELAEALQLAGVEREAVVEAVHIANGPPWQLLRLRSVQDVLSAQPVNKSNSGASIGLVAPDDAGWEVRGFFTKGTGEIAEDPVTGSLNAGIAQHLFKAGLASGSYVARQGRKVGADGMVRCTMAEDGTIWIGGRTDTIAKDAALGV